MRIYLMVFYIHMIFIHSHYNLLFIARKYMNIKFFLGTFQGIIECVVYNLFASNIHLEGYLKYTKENVENKTRKGFNKNKCERIKITIVFLNIVICFIALNFIFNYNIWNADTCYHI